MKNFKLAFLVACFATRFVTASEDLELKKNQQENISSAPELEFNACLVEFFNNFPMDSQFDTDPHNSETVLRTPEFDAAYAIHLAKAYEYCNEKFIKLEKTA